jgi:hypothetical protein
MAAHFPAPIDGDVRDLLSDLLGRSIVVDKVARITLDDDESAVVAEYVTDDGSVGALCVVDAPLAMRCGAALSMVPSSVADEAVKRAELPDQLLENWKEVANVFAQLLNGPKTPHLRLQALHPLPGDVPQPVDALLRAPEFRRDFELRIEDYGAGRFSLLVG